MAFLAAAVGLLVGGLLDWSGDLLVHFSRGLPFPSHDSDWRTALVQHRGPMRPPKDWAGVAVSFLISLVFGYLWTQGGASWRLLETMIYASLFGLIMITDLRYRLILNVVVYPAVPLVLLVRLLSSVPEAVSSLLGGSVGLVSFLLVMLIGRGALGLGDVKLAALIGVVVGFPQVLWALILGVVAGGIGALLILATGQGGLKSYIPYGPFLCLGPIFLLVNPLPPLPGT